jgi:glycosyltransferase involved in cell wall biosynthesis
VLFLDHVGVLGGAELCLLDVAVRYADSGKVLLLADGPFRERLERAEVSVEVLPTSPAVSGIRRGWGTKQDLRALPAVLELSWRVARMARGYDVLYANSQKALIVGALAGKIARRPVIWHLHDILTADHFSQAHRRLAVAVSNLLVSRVVANSRATAEAFAESGGRVERVRVVYNGIDPTPFRSVVPAEVDNLRRELGLAGVPVVSVFSRLAPWKGQHVLLEALARLPGVHAMLVGAPLFGEDNYAKDLRQRAEALDVADRVRFLGFRRDVPSLMHLSDIVVHTSVAPEPFGRVIVEGMLARRPVVASRAGGAAEIVHDGVSGVLVAPGDADALAAALTHLLANPAKAQALAETGYKMALARFSLRSMLENVEQQMQQAAAQRTGVLNTFFSAEQN